MKLLPLLLVVLIAPTKPISKRIILLVDVSASMGWDAGGRVPVTEAMDAAARIARQPVDEAEILVMTFTDATEVYPEGWISLPDAEKVAKCEGWLRASVVDGNTHLGQALKVALRRPESDLTIVVVSDGKLHMETPESLLKDYAEGQAARKDRAVVGVWGVCHSEARPELLALANAGGGGYVVSGFK